MNPRFQEFLHRFEVGEGAHWLRGFVALLALLAVAALFLLFEFSNLSQPGAMDAAQVARQLSQGEGFTTKFIRPHSVHLLERQASELGSTDADAARLHSPHPDLANPPLYPALLAAVFRVLQPDYKIPSMSQFTTHDPDRIVVAVNLCLVIVLAFVCYHLAWRLFDSSVAGLATLAVTGAALPWRTAGSGEASTLAVLLVTLLALCLTWYDQSLRDEEASRSKPLLLAALVGLVVGLAGLTAYGLLLLVVPTAILLFPGLKGRSWTGLVLMLLACLLTVGPWLVRNYTLSGQLFGTASAALFRDSAYYPGDELERSFTEELTPDMLREASGRIVKRLPEVMQTDVVHLGGSWIAAFFLVGLIFTFSDPSRNVLRSFALLGLTVLLPAQTLLGPGASPDSEMGGTDYLQVFGPLVLIIGTAFFLTLLENTDWQVEGIRVLVTLAFGVVALLPVTLMLLPPKANPRAIPPSRPPVIQLAGEYLTEEELMMSDIPWAVAWYADRKSIWLSRYAQHPRAQEDFFAVHSRRASVSGLYLTQTTTEDPPFISSMLLRAMQAKQTGSPSARDGTEAERETAKAVEWPEFAYRSLSEAWLPDGFPLKSANREFLFLGHLLVLDEERWVGEKEGVNTTKNIKSEMLESGEQDRVENP